MPQQVHCEDPAIHGVMVRECKMTMNSPHTNEVKHGWVLAPTLFSMVFSVIMTDAFRVGVGFGYCTASKLFNTQRLQAKTKVHENTRPVTSCWPTPVRLIPVPILICRAAWNYSLKPAKNSASQQAPAAPEGEPYINVNGYRLVAADNFTSLGCNLPHSTKINKKVTYRIPRIDAAFSRLKYKIWERKGRNLNKLKVYGALVISLTALCVPRVDSLHAKYHDVFHIRCLRKLLAVKLQDRVQFNEVL